MEYWGEFWSLLCAVFWALAVILFRLAVREIPPIEMSLFKNTFALLLFLITWWLVPDSPNTQELSRSDILLLMLSGVIGIAMGDTLFMFALNRLGAGRSAILSCLFSPFVVMQSFLFLGERFALPQLLGFILILTGVLFAVYQKSTDTLSRADLVTGTLLAVSSVFCMATGMVTTKPILTDTSPIVVACVRLAGGVSGVALFVVATGRTAKSIRTFKSPLPWHILFLGAFIGSYLALFAWIVGFKHTTASIASILNQTSVFFILILAVPILKERLTVPKASGAILGFAGVALILYHA